MCKNSGPFLFSFWRILRPIFSRPQTTSPEEVQTETVPAGFTDNRFEVSRATP